MLARTQKTEERKEAVENVQNKSSLQPQHKIFAQYLSYLTWRNDVFLAAKLLITMNKGFNMNQSKEMHSIVAIELNIFNGM